MIVRALVVDDSASMRQLLATVMNSDPEIEVVGEASHALEAREMIKRLNPDVISLDVEMPGMNGLEFLEKIMKLRPMPVVMISSHTGRGTQLSVEALSIGAFACLPKPRFDDTTTLKEICEMIKLAGRSKDSVKRVSGTTSQPVAAPVSVCSSPHQDLVVLGSSTGGVEALTTVLASFPADCPPTVVTQHMPAAFTKSLASRLNRHCAPTVKEAENRAALERGCVYIAPGSVGHTTVSKADVLRLRVKSGEPVCGHMPSVDVLFESVAELQDCKVSAAILTGMGRDGAQGLLSLRQAGAVTIAQDEQTSLVYGMPAVAKNLGAPRHVLPITEIGAALFSPTIN